MDTGKLREHERALRDADRGIYTCEDCGHRGPSGKDHYCLACDALLPIPSHDLEFACMGHPAEDMGLIHAGIGELVYCDGGCI